MTNPAQEPTDEIRLFEAPGGEVRIEVRLVRDTVWLSLNQIAELFGRNKSVISRHLRGIFSSGELERGAVVARNATTAADGKTYQVEYFNLDAILSVGYRVNSRRGTQFRIWATMTLREHLLRGYTLNERRLRERGVGELEQAVGLLARTLKSNELVSVEGRAVLDLIVGYASTWRVLLEYDEDRLAKPLGTRPSRGVLDYSRASPATPALRAVVIGVQSHSKAMCGAALQNLPTLALAPNLDHGGDLCNGRCRVGH